MGTSSYIYAIGKRTLAAIVCALTLLGCDSVIYDGEGDCSVNYRVKFRYDMNLKFADAFAREVESVTLYLLDGERCVILKDASVVQVEEQLAALCSGQAAAAKRPS